jgi:heat shock protein HslJ
MRESQFFYLLLLVLLLSCTTKQTEKIDVMRLNDIWALDSIKGEKIVLDENIKNLPNIEIYVEDKRVYGNTGCNSFNGKVKIDDNKITFSEIIATEMACPGNLEQSFLSSIQSIDNYKIEKLRLILLEGEVERMVFRKID